MERSWGRAETAIVRLLTSAATRNAMTESERPSPDALLAAIEKEAARQQRGELKVFLGMCPGVGKTYAMLEAAQAELRAGREVVIGYVETHGRKETDALAKGFETIP